MELTVDKVMNRDQIRRAIEKIIETSISLLDKKELEPSDYAKIKVIRSMSPAISSGVLMVQQETAQQRNLLIKQRMDQWGYFNQGDEAKKLL